MAARGNGDSPRIGHNGGPPLDDPPPAPEWGPGGIGGYFAWKAARATAWRSPPRAVVLMRLRNAERLGLTYEEYTLEILDRGRWLQVEDGDRVAAIKAARKPGQ